MAELSELGRSIGEIDAGRPCSIVYRPGDMIRIVEPRFVFRVGYPLTWPMLRDEVQADPRMQQTATLWGIGEGKGWREVADGICRALVRVRHFGGRERSVYISHYPSHVGAIAAVLSKRTVLTGTYNAPHMGHEGPDGWPDYVPGYLHPVNSRVLLKTDFGEIERCYVEKLGGVK